MSSQDINEMLTCVSQIMHQIEQGDFSETEIELTIALFSRLTNPETRADVLRSFTRTIATLPPAPPVTEPPDEGPFVVESEKEPDGREETTAISAEPPPRASFAAKIGAKPSMDTTYGLSDGRISRHLRDAGPRPTRLDEETTKNRRIINVSSLRGPKDR